MTDRSNASAPILIVDAEEDSLEHATRVLRRIGYPTVQAKSGEEAIEIARRERPSVVVLEVCLPGICGYQVCRELREAFDESLPIVFVSGTRREPYDRVGGLLLGADDYLAKPFTADDLLASVRTMIRRSPPHASVHTASLTPREVEVLQLAVEGLSQKEVAGRLFISPKTVGTHMEHIYSKLGVRNRAQALARFHRDELARRGLVGSASSSFLPSHVEI